MVFQMIITCFGIVQPMYKCLNDSPTVFFLYLSEICVIIFSKVLKPSNSVFKIMFCAVTIIRNWHYIISIYAGSTRVTSRACLVYRLLKSIPQTLLGLFFDSLIRLRNIARLKTRGKHACVFHSRMQWCLKAHSKLTKN